MSFPAISIIQPWPWLILRPDVKDPAARTALREAQLIKDVENRSWASAQRGWVLLHSSATRLPRASRNGESDWGSAAMFAAKRGVEVPLQGSLVHGAVVGAIRIDGCEGFVPSRWFMGPIGYRIGDAMAFAKPVPCLGALKFFTLPPAGSGPGGVELAALLEIEIRAAGLAAEFKLTEEIK